jgi:cytochrome c peroxidase
VNTKGTSNSSTAVSGQSGWRHARSSKSTARVSAAGFLPAALLAAAALVGCGGDGGGGGVPPRFTIAGTATGLNGTLVLRNNGANDLSVSANGTFAFSATVTSGGVYGVTVHTQPSYPAQDCVVTNGSGTANANVTNVSVACRALPSPALLADAGVSSATLSWIAPGEAASFNVYVSSAPECDARNSTTCPDGALFANVSSPHTVAELRNAPAYYFQLETVYANGSRGFSNEVSAQLEFNEEIHNAPVLNSAGTAATFSAAGSVDLNNPFHLPIGSNGRTCESCHLPHAGWSIRPVDVELLFLLTRGADPMFSAVDADRPAPDLSSPQARYDAFSMLRRGLFRRGGNVPATAEYEIVAFDDPLGAGASLTAFRFFRRPPATANFHIAKNIGWHDQFTAGSGNVPAGLAALANAVTVGALGGPAPDASTVEQIVSHQMSLSFAQVSVFGVGSLESCGAQGGPQHLSQQSPVEGRFNLFDAWINLVPGSCTTEAADRKRAQIARGQEIFNSENANGRSCNRCHNAQNNGSHVEGRLFDVGASRPQFRKPGMPLYTVRNKATQEERQTTDPGTALRTGLWADMDRFKTTSLRGAAARPPYFHNGIAPTLRDVVLHYEAVLGFVYTPEERDDLVAFLEAL